MAEQSAIVVSIDEIDINSGRIMEKTGQYVYSPGMLISVPTNYRAVLLPEDGEPIHVKSCQKKKLSRYFSSDMVGKRFSALYVTMRPLTVMSWGIGSLPIRYSFLDNACMHVGAGGTLMPRIDDPIAFFNAFGKTEGAVNTTECASAITLSFRKMASEILVDMFNEAMQPIFETTFMVSEMERRLNEKVCSVPHERAPGIIFDSATVTSIRVNEEDKNAIIERFGKRKK